MNLKDTVEVSCPNCEFKANTNIKNVVIGINVFECPKCQCKSHQIYIKDSEFKIIRILKDIKEYNITYNLDEDYTHIRHAVYNSYKEKQADIVVNGKNWLKLSDDEILNKIKLYGLLK